MNIGVIGLGDIAQKAYLPVLTTIPGITLHLCTRNQQTLKKLAAQYRVEHVYTSVDEMLSATNLDAAFVHSSTETHSAIVTTLLERGIHVYVDKPLSNHYEDVERAANVANEAGRILMVGFNRRFAPAYRQLSEFPHRHLMMMQKNRVNLPSEPRRLVFDDFIHVVDTLCYLAPDQNFSVQHRCRIVEGKMQHVMVQLNGDGWTAVGVMNRCSGMNEETLEVMGGNGKTKVINLRDVIVYDKTEQLARGGDWVPMTTQRGFEAICSTFLEHVRQGTLIPHDDMLRTHRICEQIVQSAERDLRFV